MEPEISVRVAAPEPESKQMKRRKTPKPPSTRELFERCTRELAALNSRYESLFRFVHDPATYAPQSLRDEVIAVPIERDMKAGETLNVRVPLKFEVRS